MSRYQIAKKLDATEQQVGSALRLSYTKEFMDEYGYGFIAPGSGCPGDIYGYILQHDEYNFTGATDEIVEALRDTDVKLVDQLRGSSKHWSVEQDIHGDEWSGRKAVGFLDF